MSDITEKQGETLEHNKDSKQENSNIVNMLNRYFFFNQENTPIPQSNTETKKPGFEEIQEWFEKGEDDIETFLLYNNENEEEEIQVELDYEDIVAILNLPFDRGMEFKPKFSEVIESYFDYSKIPELQNSDRMMEESPNQKEGIVERKRGDEYRTWKAKFLYFHPTSEEKMELQYSFCKTTKTAKLELICFK